MHRQQELGKPGGGECLLTGMGPSSGKSMLKKKNKTKSSEIDCTQFCQLYLHEKNTLRGWPHSSTHTRNH